MYCILFFNLCDDYLTINNPNQCSIEHPTNGQSFSRSWIICDWRGGKTLESFNIDGPSITTALLHGFDILAKPKNNGNDNKTTTKTIVRTRRRKNKHFLMFRSYHLGCFWPILFKTLTFLTKFWQLSANIESDGPIDVELKRSAKTGKMKKR